MEKKSYPSPNKTGQCAEEPAVTYRKGEATVSEPAAAWNPNVPFVGTPEEWWEHFRQIEQGEFVPLEAANQEFDRWKERMLASRL